MKEKLPISLEKWEKRNPFSVPENYFENFSTNLDSLIVTKRKTRVSIVKKWMYVAAVFASIITLGSMYYSSIENNNNKYIDNYESYVLSQVDENAIIDYYTDKK